MFDNISRLLYSHYNYISRLLYSDYNYIRKPHKENLNDLTMQNNIIH